MPSKNCRWFAVIALILTRFVAADEISIVALDGQVTTTTNWSSWTFDDAGDAIEARDWPPTDFDRGLFEFALDGIPAGSTIESATLTYMVAAVGADDVLELHAYAGDGVLEFADAFRPDLLVATSVPTFPFDIEEVPLDLALVQPFITQGTHLGLRISMRDPFGRIGVWSTEAAQATNSVDPPVLRIVYTPPSSGCATAFYADFGTVSATNASICDMFPHLFETCRGHNPPDLSDFGNCTTPGDARMYIGGGFPAPAVETVCLDLSTTSEAALVFSYSRFPNDSGPFVAVRLPGQQSDTIWLPPFTNETVCATVVIDLAEHGLVGQQEVRFIFYGSTNLELTSFDDIELVLNPGRCACDFDPSARAINVFDLLAYLDLWFSADTAAEMTQDAPARIDVFDLLSFLDCWFLASSDPAVCL